MKNKKQSYLVDFYLVVQVDANELSSDEEVRTMAIEKLAEEGSDLITRIKESGYEVTEEPEYIQHDNWDGFNNSKS